MKNEKRFKTTDVYFNVDWQYGTSIERMKEDIVKLEELGVTHIYFEVSEYYGDITKEVKFYTKRLETDKEFKDRIAEEETARKHVEKIERLKWEELNKKYGK